MIHKTLFMFAAVLLSRGVLSEDAFNNSTAVADEDSPVQQPESSELPVQEHASPEVPVTSSNQKRPDGRPPPSSVEPLDIHGLDNKQTVFHQKHQVPDGSILGTYGYYDSRNRYHVLNYVHDLYGIRILSDYMPFNPLAVPPSPPPGVQRPPLPPRGHHGPPPPHHHPDPDTEESDDGRRGPPQEPLTESDGDNLLRDEHSVIRTTVVPPPYGDFRFYQGGNDVAGTQALPFGLNRRNGTQHYYFNQGGVFQNQRGHQRIPYPYENPLYPLLYQDPKGSHSGTDDDVNDTSGLDTSDGVSEVPSKPIRHHRPVQQHLPAQTVGRPQYDSGYGVYNRPQYQNQHQGYYQQYAQPQHNYIVPQSGHYQTRQQVYYPQHQYYHPQQQQNYYYQPVVSAGYNRYEPYHYGYNH